MKKFSVMAVMLAVLLLAGCDDGSGNKDDPKEGDVEKLALSTVFDATEVSQEKASAAITGSDVRFTVDGQELWGELVAGNYDASAYKGFSFEYKSSGYATIFAQDTNSIFIFGVGGGDGWGAVASQTDWTALELPFSILKWQDWFGTEAAFDAAHMIKFAVQITEGGTNKSFEIRNFSVYK